MFSIVICTYRRGEVLRRTLQSLSQCDRPEGLSWEVLLVDNSTGREAEPVAQEYGNRLPIRYLCEPAPGVSNARNRGIAESRGEIIWFLDDDVRLDHIWVESVTAALAAHPEVGYFWGRVVPDVDREALPGWIALDDRSSTGHAGTYCNFDYGAEDRPMNPDEAIGGGNLGIRRAVFQKLGTFRADLCPIGKTHRLGGDTEFGQRLIDAGVRGFYIGSALAYHYTPGDRLTVRYVLRWSYQRAWASQHIKAIRFARAGKHGSFFRCAELGKNLLRMAAEFPAALVTSPFVGIRRRVAFWMRVCYRLGRLAACFAPKPDLALDWPEFLRKARGAEGRV